MGSISLSEVTSDRASVEADLSDLGAEETLTVVYRPSRYTPELEAKFMAADETRVRSEAAVALLSGTLISWELTNEGKPVGIDADSLRPLPLLLLAQVVVAISEDLAGKANRETRRKG